MTTSQILKASLNQVLLHDPWYGPSTYTILNQTSFTVAYEKPGGSVHSIAGIILHMLGWTQEVMARMNGQTAGEPQGGDWPDPGMPNEQKWKQLIADLKLSNVTMMGIIQDFPPERWETLINDERNREPGTGVTYNAMIEGLIQHHIYHSGQIALLNRILGS